MKKFISLILCLALAISFSACELSDNELAEPDNDTLRKDVQDYITELIDASAHISIFEKTNSVKDGEQLVVTCVAMFESSGAESKGTFTLTYVQKNNTWELDKCRAELDEQSAPTQTAPAKDNEPTTEEPATEEPTTTPNNTGNVSVSDDWTDFTFELSGVIYKLPTPYQSFVANGWKIDKDSYNDVTEETEIPANSRVSVYLTNGAVRISADLINMSGNVKLAANCDIGGITVSASNNLGLVIAKGITCQSTVEEVQAAFGVPGRNSSYNDYVYLQYQEDSYVSMSFYIYNERTTNNEITLRNFVATDRDVTVVSNQRPEYLDSYIAPTTLSNDVKATQFILDGVLYQLPCPLDEFTKNGWEISSDLIGTLGARNLDVGITLKKGDAYFYVGIMNLSDTAAYSKNCAVYHVEFSYSSLIKKSSTDMLKIPGPAKIGDGEDIIDSAYSSFNKSTGSGYASYTYQTEDYSVQVRFWLDTDDTNYNSITFENRNWDY